MSEDALVFSPASPSNLIGGHAFPLDMPDVRWPKIEKADAGQERAIRECWAYAHLYTWRAAQVVQYVSSNVAYRERLWNEGYVSIRDAADGSGYANYALRGWFGTYDRTRLAHVRRSIAAVWTDRFLGRTFTIKCRTNDSGKGAHPCYHNNPGTGEPPSANHIVLGTVNLCSSWFSNKSVSARAGTLIHELFHWLRIPKTGWWITDRHDWYDGDKLWDYRAVRPQYGDRAAYLATHRGYRGRNYARTTRNNDNYALFIRTLGRSISVGRTPMGAPFTQFPGPDFPW